MFTPAGEKSRAARASRKPRLGTADQPAVPIAGPPSYSYGSPNPGRPRQTTIRETKESIAGAFNAAVMTADRQRSFGELPRSVQDEETESQYSISSRRTPRKKLLTLQDIEASENRRRSLRSGSRSLGRGSPSIASSADLSELKQNAGQLSLEYDVSQPSYSRSYDDSQVLLAQLDRPGAASQAFDDTIATDRTAELTEEELDMSEDEVQHFAGIFGWMYDTFHWWLFVLQRICRRALQNIKGLKDLVASGLQHVMRPGGIGRQFITVLILLTALSIPLLYYGLPNLPTSRTNMTPYRPSPNVPHNADEIVSRIMKLENALGDHSKLLVDVSAHAESGLTNTERRLLLVERRGDETDKALADMSRSSVGAQDKISTVRNAQDMSLRDIARIDETVQHLQLQLTNYNNLLEKYHNKDLDTESAVQVLESEIKQIQTDVQDVILRLHDYGQLDKEDSSVLKTLRDSLPTWLVDSLASDDNASSTAAFWHYLKKVFVTKDELYNPDTLDHVRQISWSNFLEINKEALESFINSQHESLNGMSSTADDENRALIRKLIKQEWSKLGLDEPAIPPQVKGTRDHLSQSSVEQVVQNAIHKHSLDVLALPDYASYSSGARVNPFLTSPTYLHRPSAAIPRMFSRLLFDIGSSWSHPPAIAIHPTNAVGMCWAFPGSSGQISIKLSQAILLTDIAIEHVSVSIAHDATTAPKDIEIWAHVGDEFVEHSDVFDKYQQSSSDITRTSPSAGFVHVLDVTYDLYDEENTVQLFRIPQVFRNLNVSVNQLLFRIKSNWGNEAYTCLYRVRAIGRTKQELETNSIEFDEDM